MNPLPKTSPIRLTLLLIFIGLTLLTLACARLDRREQPTPTEVRNTAAPASGSSVDEIEVGGQTRRYRLHVPPGTQSGQAVPLVINLHGLNSNAGQQETVSRMSDLADQVGFIVVYPEGLGSSQK